MSEVWKHQATDPGVQAHGGFGVAQAGLQGVPSHMVDRGVHQHGEEDADQGVAVHGRSDAPSPKRKNQRKASTQDIQHRSPKEAPVVAWPFLYSYRGDTVIINKGVRKTHYQQAQEVGEALI